MLMYEDGCARVGRIAFSTKAVSAEGSVRYHTETRVEGQPWPCSSSERNETRKMGQRQRTRRRANKWRRVGRMEQGRKRPYGKRQDERKRHARDQIVVYRKGGRAVCVPVSHEHF